MCVFRLHYYCGAALNVNRFIFAHTHTHSRTDDATISKLRGDSATLTCPIDVATCGDLHSVKWFRGTERMAFVSGDGSEQTVETAFSGKVLIEHKLETGASTLHLRSVQIADEARYVCETTFLEPLETCGNDGSYTIQLLINSESIEN